jgi:hypothetical protein
MKSCKGDCGIFSACTPFPFGQAADTVKKDMHFWIVHTEQILDPNFLATKFCAVQNVRGVISDHFCSYKIVIFLAVQPGRRGTATYFWRLCTAYDLDNFRPLVVDL